MSNAQKQFASGQLRPRFEVLEGNRRTSAAPAPAPLVAVPAIHRRYRGLSLVSGAEKPAPEPETISSFDQARRIVAQVEWEIEQQAARERQKNVRRWQPLTVPAVPAARPARTSAAAPGMDRLRRFFGL